MTLLPSRSTIKKGILKMELYNRFHEAVKILIEETGDNPDREGLKHTPERVWYAYREMFGGYGKDIEDIFTSFENTEKYNEIILLKNIEFTSTCEHHMMPFMGMAHVAYIPAAKIVGISKLARLVDAFSRRLQIQERITEQVANALMEHLQPVAAACILDAKHCCLGCRGVMQTSAVLCTSSLKGAFLDKPHAKHELMSLIKG